MSDTPHSDKTTRRRHKRTASLLSANICLDDRIVEHGTHASLVEQGGMYAALYDLHRRISERVGGAQAP